MSFLAFCKKFFSLKRNPKEISMKKYLVVGLGNVGSKYDGTRHNIGFEVLEKLANVLEISFEADKLGSLAKFNHKGRSFILLKPATYMNLSGKAVRYWLTKENIAIENLLIICDDISIPLGTLRLKAKGGAGGHNGLESIQNLLGTPQYARLRFGIGNNFSKGRQSDYVLGEWKEEEIEKLPPRIEKAAKAVLSFGLAGINNTMNGFNGTE